jgi:hypothetical protein
MQPVARQTRSFAEAMRERLVDEAFRHYLDWRDECALVAAAYRNWSSSSDSDSVLAFAVYVAALDREERAASQYQAFLREADRALPHGGGR